MTRNARTTPPAHDASSREVATARVLPAPRERVWEAFADPAQLARWWGPAGFRNEFREFDLRPGGRWRFEMLGPDGARYPQDKEFLEVERPARVALRHHQAGHDFTLTLTFDEAQGGTRVTWRMRFASAEDHAASREAVAAGNEQNLDRLAAHLEGTSMSSTSDKGFTIERTFKAGPEKVWRMWTTPEGIARWWVPSMRDMGFEMAVRRMDVRVGGGFAFSMRNAEHDLVNGGTYTVVRPHEELAWTWHFDIFLKPGEAPYDVPIRVTLHETPEGGTRMVFTQGPLASPGHTEGSRQGVLKNLERMAQALGE